MNKNALYLTIALLGFGVSPAKALIVSSSGGFNVSATLTDTNVTSTAATATNQPATGSYPVLSLFDPSLGVLTAATWSVNSNRTLTVNGNAGKSMGPSRTVNFSASADANLALPGSPSLTFGSINASASCNLPMGMGGSCSASGTSGAQSANGTASVAASALNGYVGAGNVTGISFTLPTHQANVAMSNTMGSGLYGNADSALNWAGTLAVNYHYLLHANPSFSSSAAVTSLSYDFGSVVQGSVVAPVGFSLYNLPHPDRAAWSLQSVAPSGDASVLSTDLGTLIGATVGAGQSLSFSASFDTSTVGSYSAQYVISLQDAVGANASRSNFNLLLNLSGTVVPVPVPAAVWLFGSLLAAYSVRRIRQVTMLA
ncbi:MAG: hypothetical protein N3A55_05630 [Methylohalobius sp.]|nr:hypothetical protein [Methylohalobius sp.]